LVASKNLSNVFSMCLGDMNGALVLGGIEEKYFTGSIVYTPIISESWYVVQLNQIVINGASIGPISTVNQLVIVDSGTTGIVLPYSLLTKITNNLKLSCSSTSPPSILCAATNILNIPDGKCLLFGEDELNQMPDIEFQFKGASVKLNAHAYLRYVADDASYCGNLGFYPQDGVGIILGDTFMHAYYTIFDRGNKTIGFATVNECGNDFVLNKISKNTIILIVISVVAGLLTLAGVSFGIFVCIRRRRSRQRQYIQEK